MPNETAPELKPCPFCGGPAQIISGAPGCHYVRCEGCSAAGDDRGYDQAIAIWNRRAPSEPVAVTEAMARLHKSGNVIPVKDYRVQLPEWQKRFADTHSPEEIAGDFEPLIRAALAQAQPAAVHSDDLAVDRFAAAMKAKLAKKRAEGRGGWENPDECSAAYLSLLLVDHVEKGDPLDVGNLAMMLHQRGERIAAQPAAEWRSMDSAPKDGTEFIALENGDIYKCHWLEQDDGEGHFSEGWWDHINQSFENPTGWLPLPPAQGGQS